MSTLIKRYFFFILGLIINSFGVAFITKSALGTSQISSIPYVLSLKFTNLSFGQTTFIFNMLFILIQLLILKVAPDVIKVPGEGLVHAMARVSGMEFGKVKIRFDVTLIIMATLLSFLFFHKLNGIGLGTIISAVLVGPMISFVNRHLPGIGKIRALADRKI